MTDLEKCKELLTTWGVGFSTEVDANGTDLKCQRPMQRFAGDAFSYVLFSFDEDGTFSTIGAYE